EENCGQTALAVFDRLSGRPSFQRAGLDSMSADGMAAAIDRPFVESDPDRIAEALIRSGRGSHTVVHVVRGMVNDDPATATSAHTFNAYFDGTNVYALDGQVGRIELWPPNMDAGTEKVTAWLVHAPKNEVVQGLNGEPVWVVPGTRNGADDSGTQTPRPGSPDPGTVRSEPPTPDPAFPSAQADPSLTDSMITGVGLDELMYRTDRN